MYFRNAELQLKLLSEDKRNAYVTYHDLRSVQRFRNQTVMAIKAPPEAKLQVPHPSEVDSVRKQNFACSFLIRGHLAKYNLQFPLSCQSQPLTRYVVRIVIM